MNRILREYWPTFVEYQAIRTAMTDLLSDADLAFSMGGETLPLGTLCREIGEVQQAYIASFRTFQLDFEAHGADPSVEKSITALQAWYEYMDTSLAEIVHAWSDEDISNRLVDRGGGWMQPLHIALDIYKEALIIFYGKASIYFRAMNKERPEQLRTWIA